MPPPGDIPSPELNPGHPHHRQIILYQLRNWLRLAEQYVYMCLICIRRRIFLLVLPVLNLLAIM